MRNDKVSCLNSLLLLRDSEGLRETLPGPVREQDLPTMGHHSSPPSPTVTVTTSGTQGTAISTIQMLKPPGILLPVHLFMMREMDAIELKFKIL